MVKREGDFIWGGIGKKEGKKERMVSFESVRVT